METDMDNDVQCCFCGPVRQCAPFLNAVLNNIEKIGSRVFQNKYAIIIFYDKSTDNSLAILEKWQKNKNNKIPIHIILNSKSVLSPYRTHRISDARNKCLELIYKKYPTCPYFAMMDFDDPNSKSCDPSKLDKYFSSDELLHQWDALSFQTSPNYYDIWALSIAPFCFSYNHFRNNQKYYKIIQWYIDRILRTSTSTSNPLVPCISAFNGFSFYKTSKFIHCKYSGDIRTSINMSNNINPNWIQEHKRTTKTPDLLFLDYGHVKGNAEDCEHRSFHMQAIRDFNAKIRISPEIIFI